MFRFLITSLLLLIITTAYACSCRPNPYFADMISDENDVVFRGLPVAYSTVGRIGGGPEIPILKVAVTGILHGPFPNTDTIFLVGQDGLNCGRSFPLSVEGEAIFYVDGFGEYDSPGFWFDQDVGYPVAIISFCGPTCMRLSEDGSTVIGPILPGIDSMNYETFVNQLPNFYDFYSWADLWLPVGSSWIFSTSQNGSPGFPLTMEIVADTLIDGKYVRILERDQPGCDGRPTRDYLCQEDFRLYLYDSLDESFHLVYDFRAGINDTVAVPLWQSIRGLEPYVDTLFYRVEDTDFLMTPAGRYHGLKRISYGYRTADGGIAFTDDPEEWVTLIDDFGSLIALLHPPLRQLDCDDFRVDGLRCFVRGGHPDTLNLIDDGGFCLSTSTREYWCTLSAEVFPNPARGTVNVRPAESGAYRLRLTDAAGRTLRESGGFVEANAVARISLDGVPPGLYFLSLISTEGGRVERIIIE